MICLFLGIFQSTTFNELDKLPSLKHLMVTVNPRIGFEETFTNAIAHIKQLDVLNKKTITPAERRGAEYDIWKKFSSDWIKTRDDPDGRLAFMKTCRAYASLVQSKSDTHTYTRVKTTNLVLVFKIK